MLDAAEDDRNKSKLRLWLEEDPVGKRGYEIVYDEEAGSFGLAESGTFIARYGSFIDTFLAM